ncbi:hypothetical protein D3C73_1400630 [compost metagenome]
MIDRAKGRLEEHHPDDGDGNYARHIWEEIHHFEQALKINVLVNNDRQQQGNCQADWHLNHKNKIVDNGSDKGFVIQQTGKIGQPRKFDCPRTEALHKIPFRKA